MQIPVTHIQLDDDGIPRTINRRVKVKMIAQKYGVEYTVDEIAEHYGISVADVYAALAYYHDNLEYFEAQAQALQPLIEEAKQYSDDLKVKVLQRMADKQADSDKPTD